MLKELWNRDGLLFGKMWEDATVEQKLLDRVAPCRAFSIASAGDTALALAANPNAEITALDINPAQIHLAQLKQALLREHITPKGLLYQDVRPHLASVRLPADTRAYWQKNSHLLKHGFHLAGRVDRFMNLYLRIFKLLFVSEEKIEALLQCNDPERQEHLFRTQWNKWSLHWAVKLALNRWLLRLIYPEQLVRALPPDFPSQMRERMERFLTAFPAEANPYLRQTLQPKGPGRAPPPYLQAWGEVDFQVGTLAEIPDRQNRKFRFFHLSNILEAASPQLLEETRREVERLAAEDALVILRFMAPRPPVWEYGGFLEQESKDASEADRAFFCNQIQIYRL